MSRTVKQTLFGLIFIVVLGFLGYWIYSSLQPIPTCFDKIQNQGEEGIDCGSVCGNFCLQTLAPIKVSDSRLFEIRQINDLTDYDALFRVSNPNVQFGSGNVEYEVQLFSQDGSLVLSKTGTFYILPGQTKYVFEPLLKTQSTAIRAELRVTKIDWQKLEGIFAEKISLVATSKNYLLNDKPGVFSRVVGEIFNSSDFDFNSVDVVVVLLKNSVPIAANRTEMRTLTAKSKRFFEVDWVSPVSDVPDRVDVEAATNVFYDLNFIRLYGTQEKFQQLY